MLESFRLIIFCVLLTVGLARGGNDQPLQTLPAFAVQAHQATMNETLDIAEKLFGPGDYNVTDADGFYIVKSSDGTKQVEFDTVSGGFWATDQSEMWNTDGPAPDTLLSDSDAIAMADALIAKLNLLPTEGGPAIVYSGKISGTYLAHECESADEPGVYKREEYPLDVSVNYDISISVGDNEYPIVGGGGKFRVTFGAGGKLIGFQGLWREIVGEKSYCLPSQAEADEFFLLSAGYLNDTVKFTSILAYYSLPFGIPQINLYPVYVYNGTSQVQNETFTHRLGATRGSQSNDPTPIPRFLSRRDAHYAVSSGNSSLEATTEWLGDPYGLRFAQQNAEGFRDGIVPATPGWNIKYNRSNEEVRVSDFTVNNDCSVDMLFYTGHANKDGWLANEGGTATVVTQWVEYTSVGTMSGDSLVQHDVKWLIIAACGPHQDETFDSTAGNVFDRWRGIFNGLHIMFAYGSDSYDTVEEGSGFTKYALQGYSLIDSWFRMAKEVQSSGVIVTAMWTDGPGGNARNDHLPGYGSVSGDNVGSSQCRWFMWTEC